MFDYITIHPSLMPEGYSTKGMQTKDFECLLDSLEVDEHGQVWFHSTEKSWRRDGVVSRFPLPKEEYPKVHCALGCVIEAWTDQGDIAAWFKDGRVQGKFEPAYDVYVPKWLRPWLEVKSALEGLRYAIEMILWPEKVAQRKEELRERVEAGMRTEAISEHPLLQAMMKKGKQR